MASETFERIREQGRSFLTEIESKQVLEQAGIPTTVARLATNADEAAGIAAQFGFPVVLKIVSPAITHKSDVGGVALDLGDEAAVRAAYDRIIQSARRAMPEATISGVSVQPMARPGTELIVGMAKDPQFGPVLLFGLGGILVEILKDVALRLIPVGERDAHQMVREIKAYPLLEGYRGGEPADIGAIEGLLLAVSRFVERHPEVEELDLNPVFAYRDGAVAVDARIVLAPS